MNQNIFRFGLVSFILCVNIQPVLYFSLQHIPQKVGAEAT